MNKKIVDIDIVFDDIQFDEKSIKKFTAGKKASQTMKGKTLEEMLGYERAKQGRKTRQENGKGSRPKQVIEKILKTKKEKGTYTNPNHGMNGKTHKESTKTKQSIKAQIRQNIKHKYNLGKNDSIPKELLLKAYKKAGLL